MSDDYEGIMASARESLFIAENFGKESVRQERESQLASVRTAEIAAKQEALLHEANEIAKEARADADIAKRETLKATRRAFWSNVIATLSLIVAIVSLAVTAFQYFSTAT
ncbi:hypothetical protein [Rheinheimera hassiensis]|uniref:hypothetical protein n=1 Tax=Rheinheimera hassiensis TaxID=1193627 RepID=UPI001F05E9B2|nr:hypothetical protein [Rheinheimera hassiensis]